MNNSFLYFFSGVLFVIVGVKIIIIQRFHIGGGDVDFTNPYIHWPLGIFIIIYGFYIIYYAYKSWKKEN